MQRTWYLILVVLLLNLPFPCIAISLTSLATDQSSLLALKAHMKSDPNKIITTNWTNSSSVCSWIGVTCGSRHHRVTALNISYMSITGTVPPQLGNLSFLISLDLSFNHFRGNLPRELSRLRRLQFFSVNVNNFSVEIPSWLGHLHRLTHLNLRNNSFNGIIPNSICNLSNIQFIEFSFNSLQGSIPEKLGNLHSLRVLSMQGNYLSGPIPAAVFNLSIMKAIAFTENHFNGSLPINICRKDSLLEKIYLGSNELSGEIPSNLSECLHLQLLSLAYNNFSGQIPRSLGKLNHLQFLSLGGGNLNGNIPQEISNLQNLVHIAIFESHITGELPINIFNISSLQVLYLVENKLTGSLPREFGNFTMLKELRLSDNKLSGILPDEIFQLAQLERLKLGFNSFNSQFPQGPFNMSTLQVLALNDNGLVGSLPESLGYGLPSLEQLFLGANYISGAIPNSISNCSKLWELALERNKFTGFVPYSLGNLELLERLLLSENNLTTESSTSELKFLDSLTNCKFLNFLVISYNPLDGNIPASIGNLSTSLWYFHAHHCKIKGIPAEIGNLTNLVVLFLGDNPLTGIIPLSIMHLRKLQGLHLGNNNIRDFIPKGLCNLHKLGYLFLNSNQLFGSIPECLGNVTSLRQLYLDSNMLTSSIPSSIWLLKDLIELDLSLNFLSGFLSTEISSLAAATMVNLSKNQFSGYIPITIGKLQNLAELNLGYNKFQGIIPTSMGSMINLQTLDLSYNNLSGSIPLSLQELRHLNYFNVSFNALTGEIPVGGPFKNFTMESFKGNGALCGSARFNVSPCRTASKHRRKRGTVHFPLFSLVVVFACIFVMVLTSIFITRYRRKNKPTSTQDGPMTLGLERLSYYELLHATDQFSESNLLGIGGFGSVYKGVFQDGKVLAIKVFNLQLEGAFKSFDVECEILRNIRHRNLNKVLGSCSNEDFKALIFEYMPNGSLEKLLYSHNYCLDVEQRLNIMIDVATALDYLHHNYSTPIVHSDLKPSNVLLDDELVAHVSDFGIAKLLGKEECIVHTNTMATLGYIAPEYGLEGLVSTRCDIYSYGIMLMETFTRKRPSDEMFYGDVSIKTWVEGFLFESPNHIIDANLFNRENNEKIMQCVPDILELALKCSVESPGNRININDAVRELQKIKRRLLA